MVHKRSPHCWLAEPLLDQTSLVEKRMFGCDAFYLHGRLMLVLCPGLDREWMGLLVPTSKEFHTSLVSDFPALKPHSVLGKWLYLEEELEDFEETARALVKRIEEDDPRIGVVPKKKKRVKKLK